MTTVKIYVKAICMGSVVGAKFLALFFTATMYLGYV